MPDDDVVETGAGPQSLIPPRRRAPNFEGHGASCEHRTVGPHRAWCLDCHEWCYPTSPCPRCELFLRDRDNRLGEMWQDNIQATVTYDDDRGDIARPDVPGVVLWEGPVPPKNRIRGDVWKDTA